MKLQIFIKFFEARKFKKKFIKFFEARKFHALKYKNPCRSGFFLFFLAWA